MTSRLGLLSLLLIALTGCVSLGEPDRSASPAPLPTPLPKVEHPAAARPVDRDQSRVVAALTRIDACALLNPAKAAAPGFAAGDKLRRTEPHACRIEHGSAWVRVELGVNDLSRFDSALRTLAGAKAYVQGDADSCEVRLPVSFQYSISFYGHWPDKGTPAGCRTVEAFATAAVPVLSRPTPANVPLADWSGCVALEKLLGRAAGRFRLSSYPTNTVDGCGDWSDDGRRLTDVSLGYGPDLAFSEFGDTVRLGARTAGVTYGDGQCWLTWNQGPSAQPDPREKWSQIVLRTPACGSTKRLAMKLIALLERPVPAGAAPQAPLLLRPADPDSDRPGACADLPATQDRIPCQPYTPVPPPTGAVEVYRHGRQDGNVVCAISQDAVRRVFGSGFRPVVEGASCIHVEPSNALQIRISVGDRTAAPSGARKVELAGRQSLISTLRSSDDGKVVSLRAEDSTGVMLYVDLTFDRPRGGGDLDTGREAKLEPLATQILEQSF